MSTSVQEVQEIEGDLFDAPSGSILMHACNVQGSWGKGIALEFKKKYPAAYRKYRDYCMERLAKPGIDDIPNKISSAPKRMIVRYPVGKTFLIPPQEEDMKRGRPAHWIACLFTSYDYGKRVDIPHMISIQTAAALEHLKTQIERIESEHLSGGPECPTQIYSCRINSGLFNVPWENTKLSLEKSDLPLPLTVVYPPGQ